MVCDKTNKIISYLEVIRLAFPGCIRIRWSGNDKVRLHCFSYTLNLGEWRRRASQIRRNAINVSNKKANFRANWYLWGQVVFGKCYVSNILHHVTLGENFPRWYLWLKYHLTSIQLILEGRHCGNYYLNPEIIIFISLKFLSLKTDPRIVEFNKSV